MADVRAGTAIGRRVRDRRARRTRCGARDDRNDAGAGAWDAVIARYSARRRAESSRRGAFEFGVAMGRFKSSLIYFAALYGGYLIYSLAVVPSLEPQMTFVRRFGNPRRGRVRSARPRRSCKRASQWFPPDAWELKTASKILETSQGVIILQNYKNQPDGNVHIEPCSIVFFPNADADLERQRHEDVVGSTRASSCTALDSAIDLRRPSSANSSAARSRKSHAPFRRQAAGAQTTSSSPPATST